MVGEVGVHLEEDAVAPGIQQGFSEGRDHRGAAAALAVAQEQVDPPGILPHRLADGLGGAVRAAVVRHPDVEVRPKGQQLADEGDHVLPLVVGRHHHEHPARHAISRRVARTASTTACAWASVRPG